MDLQNLLADLGEEHRANLSAVLNMTNPNPSSEELGDEIKWLYHSKSREAIKASGGVAVDALSTVSKQLFGKTIERPALIISEVEMPSYDDLVHGLAKKLGVDEAPADLSKTEKYIVQAYIAECLTRMTPQQREDFFEREVETTKILGEDMIDSDLKGPMRTMAAMGLAKAAGFQLYIAATTALGFATHAVGVTLPFAAYTGMTSTIGFLIGPGGWLAVSGWALWRVTGPEWKKLLPLVIYLIYLRAEKTKDRI